MSSRPGMLILPKMYKRQACHKMIREINIKNIKQIMSVIFLKIENHLAFHLGLFISPFIRYRSVSVH